MKGRMSEEAKEILNDEKGREELRQTLISGKEGSVNVGRVRYRVYTAGSFNTRRETPPKNIEAAS